LAANQTHPTKVRNNIPTETAICQSGTPNGMRIIITIGEVNGIIENVVATTPCGLFITVKNPM
jgi:hypothetical protein